MTPEQAALAKQLASLPGFRWEGGMRVVRDDGEAYTLGCAVAAAKVTDPSWHPDLTDNATGGVLLGWLAHLCHTQTKVSALSGGPDEWEVWTLRGMSPGATLAEACARALVAIGRCA